MKNLDYSIYIITASRPDLHRTHLDVARAAAEGGAGIVQFRDKDMPDKDFQAEAFRLAKLTSAYQMTFIVNDRLHQALASRADGVHIGCRDMSVDKAKSLVASNMIIGASAASLSEARQALISGADYLGVGPVFPTTSKEDAAEPIGLEELANICRIADVPVVAIGGIHAANIDKIKKAGASGAAVIAAVVEAPDMVEAVRSLRQTWERT